MIIHINCTLGSLSVVLTLAELSGLSCIEFLCASHRIFLLLPVLRTEFITHRVLPSNISGCSHNSVLSPCSWFFLVTDIWLGIAESLYFYVCFTDFRDSHDGSWFMEMEQHPSVLVVYQWLNGYGKIRRAPAGCRPSVRLPILEYHDLTLSRFSRYVWEAVHRPGAPRWAGTGLRVRARLSSLSLSLCPYSAKSGRPGRAGGSRYSEFVQISHTLLCRNRRKSKWRNRRRAGPGQAGTGRRAGSATVRYWLALALLLDDSWWGSGPIQIADPGMWKWLTADQVDREIPFLQHLWWIVSGSCSVFLWQGNAGGMRQPQGPGSLRGLLNIERDSPCQLNSDSHLRRSGSQLFLTFRHKIRKNTHKSSRHSTWRPDWTQRFPVSRKTRLILDLEDYNYVVSLLGCNNPGHWVLTRHHPISNTSSNKLKLGRSRFLPKTPDKWHYAGSW